jgi:hypothetical protein
MRTRASLEAAFASYWPPEKPQSKAIPLAPGPEVVDLIGVGQPAGWGPWNLDRAAFGVECRISLPGGESIQFRNTSGEVKKVEARFGNETFKLTLDPGQYSDIQAKGAGRWWWTVVQ